jgi:DNA-binding NtrC family response regulator
MTGDARVPQHDEQTDLARVIYQRSRERWGEPTATVMIGRHTRFTAVLDRLQRFAESDSPVLISGETGTGKELFARGVYLLSRRADRPFMRVNCAQYQDAQLMASELFGHKKGSFTGAMQDHTGLFESGHTGVVFLDEVAELSLAAQAMLLRVLSEGELVPVGDNSARRVDVRVVAASSVELGQMVQTGRFRRDLYYRLRGLQLQVPAVRDRGRDWELIREYYLRQLTSANARRKRFSEDSIEVLSRYDWPGNVRELKALVETGFHLSEDETIEPQHFLEGLEDAGRLGQLGKVPFIDVETDCYEQMTSGKANFWQAVCDPYKKRELSRHQVQAIIARGLAATHGSYKQVLPLFGIAPGDYLRFMDFLRHHKLKPTGPRKRRTRT